MQHWDLQNLEVKTFTEVEKNILGMVNTLDQEIVKQEVINWQTSNKEKEITVELLDGLMMVPILQTK